MTIEQKVQDCLDRAINRREMLKKNRADYLKEDKFGLAQDALIKINQYNVFIINLEEILKP